MRALLLALLLIPLPVVLAQAGGTAGIVVNLKIGRNHGCSSDWFTWPDLQARVFRDDTLLAETFKAQDMSTAEWFALVELPAEPVGTTLSIEVREAEPGGWFFTGTSWWQCDVARGPGAWLNVTVDAEKSFAVAGDGPEAAYIEGHVAPRTVAYPTISNLRLVSANGSAIRIAWDATGSATDRIIVRGAAPTVAMGTREAELSGLHDGKTYHLRVVRDSDPWIVGTPFTSFSTPNVPPPAPTVQVEPGTASAHIRVESSAHDLKTLEIHVADAPDFAPNESTLRSRNSHLSRPYHEATVAGLDARRPWYVKGVATDAAGLSNVSEAMAFRVEPPKEPLREHVPDATTDRSGIGIDWRRADPTGFVRFEVVAANRTVATVTDTIAHVTTLAPNQTHALHVRGVRANGTAESSLPVEVTWTRPNRAPVLLLEVPTEARVMHPVVARVVAEDPDGDPLQLSIDWGDGTVEPASAEANHTYLTTGEHVVRLTATEPHAPPMEAAARVVVRENRPPVVSLEVPPKALVLQPVTARVVADDPEGDPLQLTIDWGDGTVEPASTESSHTYAAAGEHVVRVTATKPHAPPIEASARIVVQKRPPVLRVDVQPEVGVLQQVTARVVAEDPDGEPLQLTIDWGDGTTEEVSKDPTHAYLAVGEHVVRVTATKPQAPPVEATARIVVRENRPPTGTLRLPSQVEAGTVVNAIVTPFDPDGDEVAVTFDWGDGRFVPTSKMMLQVTREWSIVARLDDGLGGVTLLQGNVLVVARGAAVPAAAAEPTGPGDDELRSTPGPAPLLAVLLALLAGARLGPRRR